MLRRRGGLKYLYGSAARVFTQAPLGTTLLSVKPLASPNGVCHAAVPPFVVLFAFLSSRLQPLSVESSVNFTSGPLLAGRLRGI